MVTTTVRTSQGNIAKERSSFMRCVQDGAEMQQIRAISTILPNGRYKTTRTYRCKKCGKEQEVTEVGEQ